MKYIYLIFVALIYYSGSAQDSRLFENTWYLHDLIIDGNSNIPPTNDEIESVRLYFFEPHSMETAICISLSATVNFIDSEKFTFFEGGMTLEGCEDPSNNDFDILYMVNFFEDHFNDVFNYSLSEEGNAKVLIVINSSGDQAIYGNEILSIQDLYDFQFSIYPNPTSEVLNIEGNTQIEEAVIYDLLGRIVLETSPATEKIQIDLNALSAGVYLVSITSEGKRTTQKIVKE